MPWRMRYLTTRDHPLAFAAYGATFLLGLTLLTGFVDTISLNGYDLFITVLWKLQLLTGGMAGLWSVAMKPRTTSGWPDLGDLLRIEAIAAGQAACGFFVYTYALISLQGSVAVPALVLGTMGLGMAARCFQAYKESSQAERLALLYDEVAEPISSFEKQAAAAGYDGFTPTIKRLDTEQIEIEVKHTDDEDLPGE